MKSTLSKNRRVLIGGLLSRRRKIKGFTQERLAQKSGLSQAQISKIESGKKVVDVVKLLDYCESLGITPTQIASNIETYLHGINATNNHPNEKYYGGLSSFETILVYVSWCDNCYSASMGENVPFIVNFTAETFPELQKQAVERLEYIIKSRIAVRERVPEWLRYGKYMFKYKFLDVRSLLTACERYLTLAAISRVTGISQSRLSRYANGKIKASPNQVARIADAINKIGTELMAVIP